jgi:malonate-semialdehyde dehydrogenase (acetylating)/methylmalonate-semialdehyde dehydrogenase
MFERGHFIGGREIPGASKRNADVIDPSSGSVQGRVALASKDEVEKAVTSASKAFPDWSATNPQRRARVLFRFKELVEKDMDTLARLISAEHGKVLADARGDVQRGLDVIEFACGIPHLQKGEYTEGAGPGIDVYSIRQPLGVGVGITPFNFPAMIPMWMFGVAIACGNTFICKPSERDPSAPMRLAELMMEAGAPDGVLNVVNGDKEAVDSLIADPRVAAVSFVGSSDIAQSIYAACANNGKRVQAFGGAKNHLIILPDADLDNAVNQLIGGAFGSAGERCMATPVAVPVGEETADKLVRMLKPRVESLKIGHPFDKESDVGPLVSRAHVERVRNYIEMGVKEGAELVVDGRNIALQGLEEGYYLGGSLFDHVTPTMKSYQDEIFGPVLQIVRAPDFETALRLPSEHQYGNGVAIFTRNGSAAREFAARVNVGMIGVNVPIPVPLSYYSFGGWKRSGFGDTNQHGPDGVRFWTKLKTVTQRWPEDVSQASYSIPVMD